MLLPLLLLVVCVHDYSIVDIVQEIYISVNEKPFSTEGYMTDSEYERNESNVWRKVNEEYKLKARKARANIQMNKNENVWASILSTQAFIYQSYETTKFTYDKNYDTSARTHTNSREKKKKHSVFMFAFF